MNELLLRLTSAQVSSAVVSQVTPSATGVSIDASGGLPVGARLTAAPPVRLTAYAASRVPLLRTKMAWSRVVATRTISAPAGASAAGLPPASETRQSEPSVRA